MSADRYFASWELCGPLAEVAGHIQLLLVEFHRAPCPDLADRLCIELEAIHRQVLLAREALLREARDPNA